MLVKEILNLNKEFGNFDQINKRKLDHNIGKTDQLADIVWTSA